MSAQTCTDPGPDPYVVDIEHATLSNENYRTTLRTGAHLQITVMMIEPGRGNGLQVHEHGDQFIRVESAKARVQMGPSEPDHAFEREVGTSWVTLVPAGTWHNVVNVGDGPLKVYALYAPPEHARGAVHATKADAGSAEHH